MYLSSPARQARAPLLGVQSLRGLAAMMVVYHHIETQVAREGGATLPLYNLGMAGVDIFFVISGFIIWVSSQSSDLTAAKFCARRAIRLVPLYWIITAFVIVVAFIAPQVLSSTVIRPAHAIASFLFIPYPHPLLNDLYPILIQGWTLNYEVAFYALFTLGLVTPNRGLTFAIVLGCLLATVSLGQIWRPTSAIADFYTDSVLLEFGFGLCVGLAYTQLARPPTWLAIGLIAVGAIALLAVDLKQIELVYPRVLPWGIPAALVVAGVVALDRRAGDAKRTIFTALGDASYSIYLTHIVALPLATKLWAAAHLAFNGVWLGGFVVFSLTLAVGMGWGVHVVLERPLLKSMHALTTRGRRPPRSVDPIADAARSG
jgi:exopolysaccharide production protein ExoZ